MVRCSAYEASLLKNKMKNSFFMKDHYPDIVGYHENELMSYLDAVNTDYLVRRKRKIRQIDSREKALEYIREARQSFLDCLGDMPQTPDVNARVVKTLDKGCYRIDNVLIESMPGYYLSANFYYPAEIQGKCPGVLFVLGHSGNGKAAKLYLDFCLEAVLNGFCVLTFDPVGQGERRMYDVKDDPVYADGGVDNVHYTVGQQVLLAGDNITRYMMWDNVKALDYLCSREEVDTGRLGVTGNSGGGQMSAFMGAYDERLSVVAPCCYLTELRQEAYYIGSQDPEQSMPGFMEKGLNKADLITLAAPKPYHIGAGLFDYFPIDGTRDAFIEARKIYRQLDAEDNLEVYIAPKPHGFWCDARESVLRFMCRHLNVEFIEDKAIDYENLPEEAELLCTPEGDIRSCNSITLQEMFRQTAEASYPKRHGISSAAELDSFRNDIRTDVLAVLGLDLKCLKFGIIGMEVEDYPCGSITKTDIAYCSEEHMKVYCTLYDKKVSGWSTVLVHVGNVDKARLEESLGKYSAVLVIETRGTGRGAMDPESWFHADGVFENVEAQYNCNAVMLGRSVLGMRVMDVLSGIRVLRQIKGFEDCSIALYGKEDNALYALFAGVLEGAKDIVLEKLLYSYKSIIGNRVYKWTPSIFAYGLLKHFDTDDLLTALLPANIRLIKPVDNMKAVLDNEMASDAFRKAFEAARLCEGNCNIVIE